MLLFLNLFQYTIAQKLNDSTKSQLGGYEAAWPSKPGKNYECGLLSMGFEF